MANLDTFEHIGDFFIIIHTQDNRLAIFNHIGFEAFGAVERVGAESGFQVYLKVFHDSENNSSFIHFQNQMSRWQFYGGVLELINTSRYPRNHNLKICTVLVIRGFF
ncbi:hypothetical protein L1987_73690 [Smallanthus sonchifolius]|uniref:Uncharacterized protein n=1 Tax=Smallanthus sonchifolius TaxID=185202 RepID=A0ACB9A558_9ASTR|nr:hypothetical protein L1987_73690 [Smallanthus sonchifolius]